MPTSIDADEAKSRFAALLERIERGEQFVITKHGPKIARLYRLTRTPTAGPKQSGASKNSAKVIHSTSQFGS